MALSAKQRPFQVGDRVRCLDPNYTFVGEEGTIVGTDVGCDGTPIWVVEIDGKTAQPYNHYAEDMELLSSSPTSFSPVKAILEAWASLSPSLQKDAAEDTLRMLVRLYGEEKK